MDSLSADPILYSSLEADEFDDQSGEEEGEEDPDDELEDEEEEEVDLKDRIVQPRFEAWLSSKEGATRELLLELYSRLEVLSYGADFSSSVRCFRMEFSIAGMQGVYEQRSLSDPACPAWDLSSDGQCLELVPNLAARWVLDEETLIDCRQFTGCGAPSASNSSSVDAARLSERFGSDTLEQLGGVDTLLQFLGTVCADSGAPAAYAQLVPFGGLSEDILLLGESTGNSEAQQSEDAAVVRKKPGRKKVPPSGGIPYKPPLRSAPKPRPPEEASKGPVQRPKPKSRSSSQSRK